MIDYIPLQDPIFLILLLLAAAKTFGAITKRFGQSRLLGEILAGVVLGPMVLNIAHTGPLLETLAELGIFFLMFIIGLRIELDELFKVGRLAVLVAIGGIVLPLTLGYGIGMIFGLGLVTSLFLGAALSITAVGVTSTLLDEFNLLTSVSGRTILGAAVVDDILGMIVLSVIFALRAGEAGSSILYTLGSTFFLVLVFFIIAFVAGYYALPAVLNAQMNHHNELKNRRKAFTIIIVFTLVLAVAARLVGLHGVIGAFIAGVSIHHALGRGRLEEMIYEELSVISFGLMTPLFFIWVGMQMSFGSIAQAPLFAIFVILAAIVGKVVGCGGMAYLSTKNTKRALFIGIGMNGRAAIELIIAELGRRLGVFSDTVFSTIVLMALVTTIITPVLLKRLIRETKTKLFVIE